MISPNPLVALHRPPPGQPLSPADAILRPLLARASEVALVHYKNTSVGRKEDGSPVTAADRAAEEVLVSGLRKAWPRDAIVGEEGADIAASDPDAARWVIDPIDGTSAFVEGLAHWGPTVARLHAGRVLVGAVWLPRLHEYYFVEDGRGAFLNGCQLPTLGDPPLRRDSVLYVPSRMHQVVRLKWKGKARNLGSHAAHLSLVAGGAAQAVFIGPGWSSWDTAAGLALIDAVGGTARRLSDGAPLRLDRDVGVPFAAGTLSAVSHLVATGTLSALP